MLDKLVEEAIAGYDRIIGLDLFEVAVDGSLYKTPYGREGIGLNPTDRGKIGWKWSVATDLLGIPIGRAKTEQTGSSDLTGQPGSRALT